MSNGNRTFAVFGLSRFGYRIAQSLYEAGYTVLACDQDETLVKRVSPHVTRAVCANVTDWDVMFRLGFFNVQTAIAAMRRSFDVAVLLVNQLKKHSSVEQIIAQADTEEKAEALAELGAHIVVFPERDTADHLFRRITRPNLVDNIPLSADAEIIEFPVPAAWDGKSLVDLRLRNQYEIYVIGIKLRTAEGAVVETQITPPPSQPLRAGDTMLLLGKTMNLRTFVAENAVDAAR